MSKNATPSDKTDGQDESTDHELQTDGGVSRREVLSAAAALSVLPASKNVEAVAERGSGRIGRDSDLSASGIFARADIGKANFWLDKDDLDDIDFEFRIDRQHVTLSVEATGDAREAGTLLEFTPEEAVAVAGHLVQAAQAYENAHGRGGADE
jgi:hypothetical protein